MSKNITIAFINNYFDIGGIQKTCLSIAKSLRNEKFTFHFINLGNDFFLDGFKNCGTCFHSSNPADIISYLKKNKIDIVQTNNCDSGSYLAYLADVPIIIERLAGMNSAFLFDKSPVDCIIASTDNGYDKACSVYPYKHVAKIYNGVDLSVFCSREKNNELIEKFGIQENEVVVGYCGRISREKCIDKLIDIFYQISEKYFAKLLLLGNSIDENYRQLLNDKINFFRLNGKVVFIDGNDKPSAIMNLFDIGVLTSGRHTLSNGEEKVTEEGLSNSVMEMLAMGIPVVATCSGETRTLVKDEINGFLVDSDNTDMFCDKLSCLIEKKDLRDKMGQNANQFIVDNFSKDKMIAEYEKTYRYVLSTDFRKKYPDRRKNMETHFLSKEFFWENLKKISKKILIVKSGNEQLTNFLIEEINSNFPSPIIDILCHKKNYADLVKHDSFREILVYDKTVSFNLNEMDGIVSRINAEEYDYLFFLFNNFLGKNYDNVVELIDAIVTDKKIVVTGLLKKYLWQ